ncbi:MAG TPA: hypothetical protein VKR59_13160 [Terriglobales bacterium]|nr:hypothetical protein [Terriglobales bacterium]
MQVERNEETYRSQRLATIEQTARVQAARRKCEEAEAEYRFERACLNELIGLEIDAWKRVHYSDRNAEPVAQ